MGKTEDKLMRPVEMSELDRTRLQLAMSQAVNARLALDNALLVEAGLKGELLAKYKMTPADEVNMQTGAITRKS